METRTVQMLLDMNAAFYAQVGESFSATRQSAWPGWERVADVCAPSGTAALRVLDAGCGNMRFFRFLEGRGVPVGCYLGVDAAPVLPGVPAGAGFARMDLLADLRAPAPAPAASPAPAPAPPATLEQLGAFDLVACFGFFHHIPGRGNRIRFLERLAACTAEGGHLALSLWRFLDNEALAAKADRSTAAALAALAEAGVSRADLEPGDRFLGWQETAGVYRYCHGFSAAEADELARAGEEAGLRLASRFHADGRTADLNAYLVFERPVWR